MAKQVMPEAMLEDRAGDLHLPPAWYLELALFAELKQPPSLDKFPGSAVLRRCHQGQVLCRLGEAGWTAFYILTADDLVRLRQAPAVRQRVLQEEQARLVGARTRAIQDKNELQAQLSQVDTLTPESLVLRQKLSGAGKEIEKAIRALANLHQEQEQLSRWQTLLEREVELEAPPPDLAITPSSTLPAPEVPMAVALLPAAKTAAAPARSWWQWLRGKLPGNGTERHRRGYIRNDGPSDIDYHRREAPMYEGAVFGEVSCMYRTPRSATVVVTRDCFILEFLRNILDAVQKDAGYRQRQEVQIRQRLVETYLRDLPLFSVLTAAQLDQLRQRVELTAFPPGTLLCDENEHADCIYLIGDGVVKEMQNVSWLFALDDIRDWPALLAELRLGQQLATGPACGVWEQLPADIQQLVLDPQELVDWEKQQLVHGLNALIRTPAAREHPEVQELVRARKLGRRTWALLADPRRAHEDEMRCCNRLLLQGVLPGCIPAWRPAEDAIGQSHLLHADEVRDWRQLVRKLAAEEHNVGQPGWRLWKLLWEPLRALLREAAQGDLQVADRPRVLDALNQIVSAEPLLLHREFHDFVLARPALARQVMEFLPRQEEWTDFAFQRLNRAFNRLILENICPHGLGRARRPVGPPSILAYRARGEYLGETALLRETPLPTTCVAYNHPGNDPERTDAPVQLVRIPRQLFEHLQAEVPAFRAKVAELRAVQAPPPRRSLAMVQLSGSPLHSQRAEELGLIEGQRLMLIDLDLCTRCDECVQACVDTHADGRSRLVLDGPRLDRFLVPTTCRSCLDPVCMIGCPVGSIHRGGQREIIIEDWCIGCAVCAKQCPYGAIQMHDVGLVPEHAHGWQYRLADLVADARWPRASYRPRRWLLGQGPFLLDHELQSKLAQQWREAGRGETLPLVVKLNFRLEFTLPRELAQRPCKLEVTSSDAAMLLWLNGQPLVSDEKARRGVRELRLTVGEGLLRTGRNVLAVQVEVTAFRGDVLLSARLDEVRKPDSTWFAAEVTEKLVTSTAVVCDLCSSLPGGPACVSACPQDAAFRVDARSEFPQYR